MYSHDTPNCSSTFMISKNSNSMGLLHPSHGPPASYSNVLRRSLVLLVHFAMPVGVAIRHLVADECVLRTVLCDVPGCQSGQHEAEKRGAEAKPNNDDCEGGKGDAGQLRTTTAMTDTFTSVLLTSREDDGIPICE